MRRPDLARLLALVILITSTVLATRIGSMPSALIAASSAVFAPLIQWRVATRQRQAPSTDDAPANPRRPTIIAVGWTLLGTAIATRPLSELVAALDGSVGTGIAISLAWSAVLFWILRS